MPVALFPLSIAFFAVCVAVNYYIQQQATATLSPEENTRIKTAWSAPLRWFFIAGGSLCALLYLLVLWPDHPSWLFRGFFVAEFVLTVAFVWLGLHRLSHLRLPEVCIRRTRMGLFIYLLGILLMGFGIFSLLRG